MFGFTFKPILFLMADWGGSDSWSSDDSWGGSDSWSSDASWSDTGWADPNNPDTWANNDWGGGTSGLPGTSPANTNAPSGGDTSGGGGGGTPGSTTSATPPTAPAPAIPATPARHVKWTNGRPAYIYYLNANGQEVIEKDYTEINRMMDEAKDKEYPDFQTYLSDRNIQLNQFDQRGLESLITLINRGPDFQGADEYSANQLGYGSDAARDAAMSGMLAQRNAGIEGQQGMTDEERASRQAMNRQFFKEKERESLMALDAMASSGRVSFAKYAMQSDQYTNALLNQKLAAEDNLAKESYERKKGEYAALDARYMNAYQSGQISATQYLNAKQAGIATALQAYATQADIMLKNNDQYLKQYSADMDTITKSIQTMYTGIAVEMGVDVASIELANNIWQQEMAPQFAQWQKEAQDRNASAQQSAQNSANLNGAVSLITGAVTALSLLLSI